MKIALGSALAALLFLAPAAFAKSKDVTCADGNTAKGGRGACSGHGGINKGGPAQTPAPARARPSAARAKGTEGVDASAVGATAKCKDGSFSHAKGHAGACSRHGGVGKWLDGSK